MSDEAAGELGLEARLRRLDEIVRALDSGELPLEEGLSLFQEGVGHIRSAEELLRTAELRVEELLGAIGSDTAPLPPRGAEGVEEGDGGTPE